MKIYCCQCDKEVKARLTDGKEIYPHRSDLFSQPFWKCDTCKNYVGCHHKSIERTKPLGNIPNKEMRIARQNIHQILDPLWKSGRMSRGELYKRISRKLGYQYHTGEIKNLDEAKKIYQIVIETKTDSEGV